MLHSNEQAYIFILYGVGLDDLAVGENNVDFSHVVDGEAMSTSEPAVSSTDSQSSPLAIAVDRSHMTYPPTPV